MTGQEVQYIKEAVEEGHLSGNGIFTQWCQQFLESRLKCNKVLLTNSCTAALEMSALLLNIKPGDEVIVPSFTFVSTALAFVRQGANIRFVDSEETTPNIDPLLIESQITHKTKALVVVHYAGVACQMKRIMEIAQKHNLFVIEDAAQAIDSYYQGKALGTIGHLSTFSFHETKNIQCGEGGFLAINEPLLAERAEIIWEKGTNRAKFFRGEIDKYNWVDTGSSFLPSDMQAAFLKAQLESIDTIQKQRIHISEKYEHLLNPLVLKKKIKTLHIAKDATNNGHIFYILCRDLEERTALISHLKEANIQAVFHYLGLHNSPFIKRSQTPQTESFYECSKYADTLLRLPLYYELKDQEVVRVAETILDFYE
ncbi:dTDP-4-amino-4,6-dideoxygalactose transaminase [Halosquirtibacter laminarini]|uniref:dTDP-4-amino-4,6-dideoxygalactose transaminase n=2 Tax=Halosquirtibacter laminarini TaxID=3374600 RepID=A0AC61NPW0_9BACT|nr:dTDP-4-amino-4,6-dideoxygalactose transaminase [Prolixibacteraceae bacterium]